jgi:hypothetical protein
MCTGEEYRGDRNDRHFNAASDGIERDARASLAAVTFDFEPTAPAMSIVRWWAPAAPGRRNLSTASASRAAGSGCIGLRDVHSGRGEPVRAWGPLVGGTNSPWGRLSLLKISGPRVWAKISKKRRRTSPKMARFTTMTVSSGASGAEVGSTPAIHHRCLSTEVRLLIQE